jgi:undecaprenyl-diphosphatase
LLELNEKLFWILNSPAGNVVDAVMIGITVTGYLIAALFLALAAIWLYGGLNRKNVILLAVTLLIGGGGVQIIKQSLPADRPLGYFAEKSPPMADRVHAPFERSHHRTFPSGHTQTAFGVAVLMALVFKRHIAVWLLWAVMVALSRVYLGIHFPLDVLGGALIGALAAYLVYRIHGTFFTTETA